MHREDLYPGDVDRIEPQASQQGIDFSAWDGAPGWKIVDSDGTIQAIFALPEVEPGRVAAFTIFSRHLTVEALKFSAREACDFLHEWGDFRRCEAYVLEGNDHEMRWCWKTLGMKLEGKLRKFAPDGRSCYIFSVVRE